MIAEKRDVGKLITRTMLIALITAVIGSGTSAAFMIFKVLPTVEVRLQQLDSRIDRLAARDKELSHAIYGNARPGLKSDVAQLQECTRSLQRQVDKIQE